MSERYDDVRALEEPAQIAELDEVFRELHDNPAWKQLCAFVDGEWLRNVKLGLAEHETPAKVSWRAGFIEGLEFLRHFPAEVARRARMTAEMEAEAERVKKLEEAERRIPRHTVTG